MTIVSASVLLVAKVEDVHRYGVVKGNKFFCSSQLHGQNVLHSLFKLHCCGVHSTQEAATIISYPPPPNLLYTDIVQWYFCCAFLEVARNPFTHKQQFRCRQQQTITDGTQHEYISAYLTTCWQST